MANLCIMCHLKLNRAAGHAVCPVYDLPLPKIKAPD